MLVPAAQFRRSSGTHQSTSRRETGVAVSIPLVPGMRSFERKRYRSDQILFHAMRRTNSDLFEFLQGKNERFSGSPCVHLLSTCPRDNINKIANRKASFFRLQTIYSRLVRHQQTSRSSDMSVKQWQSRQLIAKICPCHLSPSVPIDWQQDQSWYRRQIFPSVLEFAVMP